VAECGTSFDSYHLSRKKAANLKKAGLPDMRLYDLRHTCATLLLAVGENPKIVSERLGRPSVVYVFSEIFVMDNNRRLVIRYERRASSPLLLCNGKFCILLTQKDYA
jgi:integrase